MTGEADRLFPFERYNLPCALPSRQSLMQPSGSRVVSFSRKFEQAEAVAEWIAHRGLSPPVEGLNLSFKSGPSGHRTLHSVVDIRHFKIEMDGRPVTAVVADGSSFLERPRAGAFQHQVDLC